MSSSYIVVKNEFIFVSSANDLHTRSLPRLTAKN